MTEISPSQFRQRVLRWFKQHGRTHLPWQKNTDPYRVWLSEIMLQQTQVSTVIDYFERFVEQYPTIHALAKAPEDAVLALWSGLGYYQRARHLHRCAQMIVNEYHGEFPTTIDTLQTLPGIGRSTAGAIAAFCFGQRAAILDGNVKRVLARFAAIEGWPGQTAVHQTLWTLAERYTPHRHIAEYTQAMMDLGAMICTRSKPKCNLCPLQSACLAYQHNATNQYPGKRPPKKLPVKQETWLLLIDEQQRILLHKRPPVGLWGGLWVFPVLDKKRSLVTYCQQELGVKLLSQEEWPPFRHTFSHFHLDIHPIFAKITPHVRVVKDDPRQQHYRICKAQQLGVPAPVKRCLQQIAEEDTRCDTSNVSN